MFGDFDPEDAYDASDPLAERLAVLERWVPSVVAEFGRDGSTTRVHARTSDALTRVDGELRRGPLFPLDLVSLVFLRARLLDLLDRIG